MIIDTSAVLAILLDEPDAEDFASAMADPGVLRISAANWFEASMVTESRLAPSLRPNLDGLIARYDIHVEPVTHEHAKAARMAWREFGRGRHPAKLNFGDCLAYGLAKVTGEPLLFKGSDFSQTDIEPALKA